jgi:molybdopterin converting factor small subunit
MPVVWIPALLQSLTGGEERVVVSGKTVRDVIDQLEGRYPGVKERLVEKGEIRPHIAVAIDGDVSPEGLQQDVQEGSEIHFIPALSGGHGDGPRSQVQLHGRFYPSSFAQPLANRPRPSPLPSPVHREP